MPISSVNPGQMDMSFLLDLNRDGQLQVGSEVKISAEQLEQIDTNKDKQLSTTELSEAFAKDWVNIEYNGKDPANISLNSEHFRLHHNDRSKGILYGGAGLGALVGMGAGALIASAVGAPAKTGAEIGALAGGFSGIVGGGAYTLLSDKPMSTSSYTKVEPETDEQKQGAKTGAFVGAGVGALVGATVGVLTLGRLGLLDKGTSAFIGASMFATIGIGVGTSIGGK